MLNKQELSIIIETQRINYLTHSSISVNKNPTRCNSMQIFIYCKVTLHVSIRPRWREVAVPVL